MRRFAGVVWVVLLFSLVPAGRAASPAPGDPDGVEEVGRVTAPAPSQQAAGSSAEAAASHEASTTSAASDSAYLALYFDLATHARTRAVAPGEIFQFMVVARHVQEGMLGWEARIVMDDAIEVLSQRGDGLDVDGAPDVWRVGLGKDCHRGDEILLGTYTARLKKDGANDVVLGIAPVEHGSFDPPAPGYVSCLSYDDLRPFAFADTVAVINPLHVQLEAEEDSLPHFEIERARR